VKTKKQKPAKEPRTTQTSRKKKPQFEDGVRAALVAAAVICAAVLGVGGFFAVRSILSGGNIPDIAQTAAPPDSSAAAPETPPADQALPAKPAPTEPESAAATQPSAPTAPEPTAPETAAASAAADPARTGPLSRTMVHKGTLIVVIDDAGNNLAHLDPFLKFPGPLTIAVLPALPNSVEAARRVRAAGKELFLHQPMEPLNGQNPGPGAITTGMSAAQVKEILVNNFTEVGPVSGFNNHEGSRATMDAAIMRPLLEVSRDAALIFLDSRTTAETVAPRVANELGIVIAERDIFLDNDQDRASILAALEAGVKRAEQKGVAILIGHAWSPQLAAILTEMYPVLTRQGYTFATISAAATLGK
jgi:polysaccharide deacetylase 2 family uncharacterized protein YibQ